MAALESSDGDFNCSDDDAPELVTFAATKQTALELRKRQTEGVKIVKLRQREKRKATQELHKAQKKEKLERLAAIRLPDNLLNELAESENCAERAAETAPFGDQAASDDDSGISNTVSSKVTITEVSAIKSRAFAEAIGFKSKKLVGHNKDIQRCTAKERQLLLEKKLARRVR